MEDTIVCPVCGVTTPADAQVCANCHTSLPPSEEPPQPGAAPGAGDGEPGWAARIRGTGSEHVEVDADFRAREPSGSRKQATRDAEPQGSGTSQGSGLAASPDTARTSGGDIYEWLRRLDASDAAGATIQPAAGKSAAANAGEGQGEARHGDQAFEQVPAWLQDESAAAVGAPAAAARTDGPIGEPPMSAPSQVAPPRMPAPDVEPAPPKAGPPPAEPPDIDVGAVFASLQAPDWMSGEVSPASAPPDRLPPAATEAEPIEPAALPSWVEAMRPVESILQQAASGTQPERSPESGPLLGLQGVLPAIPGVGRPSKKPGVRAMRLSATEQQRARATLLEQVLADETSPTPLKAAEIPVSQRGLRWAITALLVLFLGGALIFKSQVFPLPAGVPTESLNAIRAIEAVPPDSRVLLVFDYEPATVGEMEASAAPLLDHLLLLRHPVLALVSTSPTGAVLGERFLSGALAPRAYQRGKGYVNLGYLPGGLAGVRAFSENPVAAVPLASDSGPAWDTAALQGINHLSDFAALIVMTDSLESGRVWIEQTAGQRAQTPLVVVSSAQAGPMLLPYAASGQVAGLVSGLNGAAGAEMANGGLPGYVRRYWDAYSFGLYLAALIILLGAGWQAWGMIRAGRMKGETF
jgi:hypothetical protein